MRMKTSLGLALMFIASFSLASDGQMTFSGKITESTCSVSSSGKSGMIEISDCHASLTPNQRVAHLSLFDRHEMANHPPSNNALLDHFNRLSSKHNLKINIDRIDNETDNVSHHNYIVVFEYY